MVFHRFTPQDAAVATLEPVSLGGVPQWVLARGNDASAPVLLFLHGGPGDPAILYARRILAPWERYFLVINWDQRGSGLSYSGSLDAGALTLDRLVEDTLELSEWIGKRFGKRPIILVGHSWGSILGILATQRAPQSFAAYVGISQFVDEARRSRESYRLILERARELGNRRAVRQLEGIGPPPHTSPNGYRVLRHWADRFQGVFYRESTTRFALRSLFDLKEYTLGDALRYTRGQEFSVRSLLPQVARLDLLEFAPRLELPTAFVAGRNDLITPPEFAREYLDALSAPRKSWTVLDEASHNAPFDQPSKIAEVIRQFISSL